MAKRVKKKPGPKSKYLNITCTNPKCGHYGQKGLRNSVSNGTYRTRSTGKAQLFVCRTCGKAFSTSAGTAFFDLRSPKKKMLMGLRLLAEGLGLRGTSRILQVKHSTIRRWLATSTLHCEQVSDMLLRGLKLSQVQADKLWTFVKKTPKSQWINNLKDPLLPKQRQGLGTATI